MSADHALTPAAIADYLQSRSRRVRWIDWLRGRKYHSTRFLDRPEPLVVVAHRSHAGFGDAKAAHRIALAIEQDWLAAPSPSRESFAEILDAAPGLIVIQL